MRALIVCILVLPLIACVASPKSETSQNPVPAPTALDAISVGMPATAIASANVDPGAKPAEPAVVDASCKVDADCTVKNVGNCCGYFPRCVNKDSATFPEQVKAQCAKQGRVGVCGFPAVSGCHCDQGRCAEISGGAPVH